MVVSTNRNLNVRLGTGYLFQICLNQLKIILLPLSCLQVGVDHPCISAKVCELTLVTIKPLLKWIRKGSCDFLFFG